MRYIAGSRRWRRCRRSLATTIVLGIAVMLAVAACGGGGSGGTSSAGGASKAGAKSDSGSFAAATSLAKSYATAPSSTGVTQPIGKPIPSGKHIVIVGAGDATGTILVYDGLRQAAKILGWSVTEVQPPQPTPADLQQAMGQVLRDNPSGVVISAFDKASIITQLTQLQHMHVPVVSNFGPDPTGGPIALQIMGPDGEARLAAADADQALAGMGKPGEIGVIGLQGYDIVQAYLKGFTDEVNRLCSSCTMKQLLVPLQDLGTSDGQDIVNFLRANPNITALMVGFDGMDTDLFSAAKAAGVSLPKTYSLGTLPPSIANIRSGVLTASAPIDYYELGWRTLDAFARIFTGQSSTLGADVGSHYERPTLWSKEYGNVPPAPSGNTFPPVVKTYQSQYQKLWGK